MWKIRITTLLILCLGAWAGISVYQSEVNESNPFKLGLDLSGGSYLVYRADTSEIDDIEVNDSMDSLRDVIERRINAFGVAEPNVQTETHSIGAEENQHRLIVELPGVTDLDQAVELIGQTPLLEFKVENTDEEIARIDQELNAIFTSLAPEADTEQTENNSEEVSEQATVTIDQVNTINNLQEQRYVTTELTGKYLEKAQLQFTQGGLHGGGLQSSAIVAINFDKQGAEIFEQITSDSIGKTIAIYLDGQLVSAPTVNTAISGGQAIIEGNFEIQEAKTLVGRLNSGALPIPIELLTTNTIGPTLGKNAVDAGVKAGILGLILVALILLLWYRLPGLIAVIALGIYTSIMLWMFKFIPITLTSAGIAGFIISIGIAVDANILIFERIKEEIRNKETIKSAVIIGFKRAWASIRDANISSIITAIILFWFGTPLIKGFALTFGLGILISMLTAVTFTRLMLLSSIKKNSKSRILKFLYQFGFSKVKDNK